MPTADGTPWAPHDTLLGQLQRGRGLGPRRAIAATGRRATFAAGAVYDCVTRDPRWDNQSDDRALYLARLITGLALPTAPIAAHLAKAGTAAWADDLAIATLGCLARLGRDDAIPALRRHVAEGHTWTTAFGELSECDPAALEGLDEVLLARADDDDLAWLVLAADDNTEPWPRWRERHPRIAAASRSKHKARNRRRHRPDLSNEPREALVATLRRPTGGRVAAARELERRGDPVLLDLVEDLCRDRPWPPGLAPAATALGAIALPRARSWLASDASYAAIGLRVIAEHGTSADAPILVAAVERALSTEDWCGVHRLPCALARLEIRAAVPMLRVMWEQTPHDYVRSDVLPALVTLDPAGSAPYLSEGLWDSEGTVRQYAAEHVPLTPLHRRQLARLRDEAPEEREVRAAAARHLEP